MEDWKKIQRELANPSSIEVRKYLPVPPSRAREFWTKWKIEHIRRLAETGRATDEILPPDVERTNRILDRILLRGSTSDIVPSPESLVKLVTPFVNDSGIELSSPLYLGDMSFGALSGIPNIAIAWAAEKTGVIAGSGEGGLLSEIASCSRITVQWASARFGVNSSALRRGQAVVIKIGQGAKPGIGGHLPGVKVTEPISVTRRIPIGKDAISPAPHHDIYSIEDLGQRILSLREMTGKPVLVKVGATNYIPYIASGIARMGASGIIIDGAGAGTGAAPSVVKDNVGIPIELAVASVDNALKNEGLRKRFTIIAGGRVSTPEDSLKLIALGADITSLGTAALISLGCIMVHKCHLGFCPAVLTNKITSNQVKTLSIEQSVIWLSNLVNGWNEEMRLLLLRSGLHDINDLRGRRDLLEGSGSLNSETLEILGLEPRRNTSGGALEHKAHGSTLLNHAPLDETRLFPPGRIAMLREMAGTIGKSAGEAKISSMGSVGPPLVEEPIRITDFLVSDGAQVTRPSIDPYREKIETATFLSGRLRLSSPFFFTRLPDYVTSEVKLIFVKNAASLGLIIDSGSAIGKERTISDYSEGAKEGGIVAFMAECLSDEDQKREAKRLRDLGKILLLRCPSLSRLELAKLAHLAVRDVFSGFILGEEENGLPLEVSVPILDRELKKAKLRSEIKILAASNSIRGSDDIFKILALGADVVGFGTAALFALGYEQGENIVFDSSKSSERLENFILAMQRDVKLLAGAAGISNISSSLVGNTELLRSIDLDPIIRGELGVKPAGAA